MATKKKSAAENAGTGWHIDLICGECNERYRAWESNIEDYISGHSRQTANTGFDYRVACTNCQRMRKITDHVPSEVKLRILNR